MGLSVEEVIAAIRGQLYIDGEWCDAEGGATFATSNPATEDVLAEVASASTGDVNRAVAAARAAFDGGEWSKVSPRNRVQLLWRLGELIKENLEEIALLETLDNGKPITESRYVEIPMCAEIFQ